MLKKISNLGSSLTNNEQKKITGGISFNDEQGNAVPTFPCTLCTEKGVPWRRTLMECVDFCTSS